MPNPRAEFVVPNQQEMFNLLCGITYKGKFFTVYEHDLETNNIVPETVPSLLRNASFEHEPLYRRAKFSETGLPRNWRNCINPLYR